MTYCSEDTTDATFGIRVDDDDIASIVMDQESLKPTSPSPSFKESEDSPPAAEEQEPVRRSSRLDRALCIVIKGEVLQAPCHLVSLMRSVPGWCIVTPHAIHFKQDDDEKVISEMPEELGELRCGLSSQIDWSSNSGIIQRLKPIFKVCLSRTVGE